MKFQTAASLIILVYLLAQEVQARPRGRRQSTQCPGSFFNSSGSGEIHSPVNASWCDFTIPNSWGNVYNFSFELLNVEYQKYCWYDSISIYASNFPSLRFCGNTTPTFSFPVSGDNVTVVFSSTSQINGTGFKLYYNKTVDSGNCSRSMFKCMKDRGYNEIYFTHALCNNTQHGQIYCECLAMQTLSCQYQMQTLLNQVTNYTMCTPLECNSTSTYSPYGNWTDNYTTYSPYGNWTDNYYTTYSPYGNWTDNYYTTYSPYGNWTDNYYTTYSPYGNWTDNYYTTYSPYGNWTDNYYTTYSPYGNWTDNYYTTYSPYGNWTEIMNSTEPYYNDDIEKAKMEAMESVHSAEEALGAIHDAQDEINAWAM